MTELQWLSAADPGPMLEFLRTASVSDRKLRLFVAACFGHVARSCPPSPFFGSAIGLVERYADGEATDADFTDYHHRYHSTFTAWCRHDAYEYARSYELFCGRYVPAATVAIYLREVVGPLPFRPVRVEPRWLDWNGSAVRRLAEAAYENREMPGGQLDAKRLMVLADALEEAGCENDELLGHLRGQGAVHVRGCWAVDLLLGTG